jgi:hypothetical protein
VHKGLQNDYISKKDKSSIKRWANKTGALDMNTAAQALSDAERLQAAYPH